MASFWTAILNFLKIPQACTGMERQEVTLSLSKAFVHYFRRLKSSQVHSFMAALTCLRSVETNLTLTCPSPKSFVCNLPDSGRHVTSVFQGLSLSLSLCRAVSQGYGHPRVLGIPIPISLAFWASPVGDAQNADRFDFA